ncbi:hypothetical protein niasHT_005738 [Heterodera trifolii]|uniref:Uncharacterized protein n=1 Tax=Heterodera trifolii TaxID=157864 RepID=A0ABD2LZY6_9BILA
MSDRRKEAEEKMAKAIFISADCWLCVFDLLEPSQLGFGISMISHRFDFYVDEHFKTRKWTLGFIRIHSKIGKNGSQEMEITNDDGKALPIPQVQLPRKVIGFEHIEIFFIDQNVIAFLQRFRQLLASFCPINLNIYTTNDRILESILRNIWPMIVKNIHGIEMFATSLHHLRQIVPSFLNGCPSLRVVSSYYYGNLFPEFPPADENAAASDEQSVVKWLFTPLQENGVPKVFKCWWDDDDGEWPLKIEAFKSAFASASSPVNFIVSISFPSSFTDSVVPFDLTNELTREQLALKRIDKCRHFLLVRCPIARDKSKWTKWEEEAIDWQFRDQRNIIDLQIYDERQIGDGLLGTTPGPSNQQQN